MLSPFDGEKHLPKVEKIVFPQTLKVQSSKVGNGTVIVLLRLAK